jgi:deazaflavin-dependent oxidoreductase (nitroreductase family)
MRRRPVRRCVLKAPILIYRGGGGFLLGHRFLLLTHIGRQSGLAHDTVLEVVHYDPDRSEAIVVSGWGRRSDWYLNLQARPECLVTIGSQRFPAVHRLLEDDEAAAVLAGYEERNRLVGPVVRFALSRLVGWRYESTDAARQRLAGQLPFVAFRPDGAVAL